VFVLGATECSESKRSSFLYPLVVALSYFVIHITESATSDAAEIVIFEMMLGSSIFVDFRVPNFKLTMKMNGWFWLLALNYYWMSSVAVLVSGYPSNSVNGTRSSPSPGTLSSPLGSFAAPIVVFNNTIALAGGIYFIYCCCCEYSRFGRRPMFLLRESSVENAKKVSIMKVVTYSQMALVCEVFCHSLQNAAKLKETGKCSQDQLDALTARLTAPCHVYAVASRVTKETSTAMRTELKQNKSRFVEFWTAFKKAFFGFNPTSSNFLKYALFVALPLMYVFVPHLTCCAVS
jgi:hypothetical protein